MKQINLIPCQKGLIDHAIKHFHKDRFEDINLACIGRQYSSDPFETDFGPIVFTTLGKEIDTKYLTTVISINGGTIGTLTTDPAKISPEYIRKKMEHQLQHCMIPNMASNKRIESVELDTPDNVVINKPLMEIDTCKLNKVIHPVWGELKPLQEGISEMIMGLHKHQGCDDVAVTEAPAGVTVVPFIPHLSVLINDFRKPEHGTDKEIAQKLKITLPFFDALINGKIHSISHTVGCELEKVFGLPAETWVNAGYRWLNAYNKGEL